MSEAARYVVVFGTFAACLFLVWFIPWLSERGMKVRRHWLEEFRARWPDRCPICSFARYQFFSGVTDSPVPPEHAYCPERKP